MDVSGIQVSGILDAKFEFQDLYNKSQDSQCIKFQDLLFMFILRFTRLELSWGARCPSGLSSNYCNH